MDKDTYEQYEAQNAMQQSALDTQQLSYAPQMMEQMQQNQAVLVDQTNPKRVVREIILRLRGMEERPDGSLVKIAEPKVNKAGMDNVWFILDSHINQNVILSNLQSSEIGAIMVELQDDLVDDLSLNWKEYGIKKKTDLDMINNSILVNVFLALKRAEHQGEKNWLGRISVENISSVPRMSGAKKGGFWDKFRL